MTLQSLRDGSTRKNISNPADSGVVGMGIYNGTFNSSGPGVFSFGPVYVRRTAAGQELYGSSTTDATLLQVLCSSVTSVPNGSAAENCTMQCSAVQSSPVLCCKHCTTWCSRESSNETSSNETPPWLLLPSALQPLVAVTKAPTKYYVNVLTMPNYYMGAVRGQLLPFNDIDPARVVPN